MAKQTDSARGTRLVIVESPAKARTIGKFLGNGYVIEASIGHIRDLPEGKKEVPEKYKSEDWAYLGVNVHQGFEPIYVVPPEKAKQVKKLKDLLRDASEVYLATDEDREGEAISWHLHEVLKPRVPVHRLVFHEITREAIQDALRQPRQIDEALVRAQETRRILDRLYGFDVSPLLWRKLGRQARSAGRVQSVAVRLIVDREEERRAFHSATYWDLLGRFAKRAGGDFDATLVSCDGRRVPAGKDFDPATGLLRDGSLLLLDEAAAAALIERLRSASFAVSALDDKPYTTKPYPPFTTSTLQQEANRKLGFTARRTMQAAQSLYENGHITYMRTDSTNLSEEAITAARKLIETQFGANYLSDGPRQYRTKVKNAQEAHEAIRPAGSAFVRPDDLRGSVGADEQRLYDMIWKRTVACQMADARGRRISIEVSGGGAVFQASGKTIDFPGYLRAYVEGSDDPEAQLADQERILPSAAVGETLDLRGLDPKSHTTQPPARYTEATLTRALEEMGIGRPSTYASIIDTILDRRYVFKKGSALVPTWTAFAVSKLLCSHLPDLVDYQFTARMEDDLDAISRGERSQADYLQNFYFGTDRAGLKHRVEGMLDAIDVREVSRISLGRPTKPGAPDLEVVVRVGRYGPFLEQGERRASLPDELPPDELNMDAALALLDKAAQGETPLGYCPETDAPIYVKIGRFGPYVQRAATGEDEKPKSASLLKGMQPENITLETALQLLSMPRELGPHPTLEHPIRVYNGRFGPYVKCGDETRSIPGDASPLSITAEEAIRLLAEPKRARRGFGAAPEPLKTFAPSPVTSQPIRLLAGKYGPYVTDGETNATVPKDAAPEALTFDQALALLAAQKERGPSKKRGSRRGSSAAAKKVPAKKAPAKKAPAKKSAKKKAAPPRTDQGE